MPPAHRHLRILLGLSLALGAVGIGSGSLLAQTAAPFAPGAAPAAEPGAAPSNAAQPGTDLETDLKPGFSIGGTVEGIPAAPVAGSPEALAAAEQAALSDVEASISLSRERAEALKREIENMKGDRAQQNAALIAAGERVKAAENDVAAMQERMGQLIVEELETRGRLDGADNSVSNVLAALERISRNPPPALLVNPSDALGSARGALLISAILPQLRARADDVMANLKHLGEIKTQAAAEEEQLKANMEVLEEEQLRIATLIVAKRQGEAEAGGQLAAEEQQASDLAGRAAALKAEIEELTRKAEAVATAAQATAAVNAGATAPVLPPDTVQLALANPARTEPAVPFEDARGFLTLPVAGTPAVEYGAGDGFGGISKGLSIAAGPGTPVRSPADGWVIYKGPYLNYGQIVILNAGQDYTILLAGLQSASVNTGDFVLMGQTVGTMGSQTIGQTVATGAGAAQPTLYIEMRKNNQPLDPTGWWAVPKTPTQSG